ILVGEQVIPVGRQLLTGTSLAAAWQKAACATHIFGLLPGHHGRAATTDSPAQDKKAS
ncbi:MAG: DUF1427 family protein, partial [Bradyrhizobium sp.]|nr:DUF1427 family protein [Bradyrhizobium sp.]